MSKPARAPSTLLDELQDIVSTSGRKEGFPGEVIKMAVKVATEASESASEPDILRVYISKANAFLNCHSPAVSAARSLGQTRKAPTEMVNRAAKAAVEAAAKAIVDGKGDNDALRAATAAAKAVYGFSDHH